VDPDVEASLRQTTQA